MKKLLALIACGCLALNLSGCNHPVPRHSSVSSPSSINETCDTPVISEEASPTAHMNSVMLQPLKEIVTADDGTNLFSLSQPQVQLVLHDSKLEAKIISDLQSQISTFLSSATQIEEQAKLDYAENEYWSEYFIDLSLTPTRLDQAVLSLFGNTSSYSGGPHPSIVTSSVTYDLRNGDMLYLDDILSPDCSSDVLYRLILQSLEDQAEDLYYDYADALGDRFTGELHGIQDWYFSRSGLCFHFAPYDIAPYSSGTIIAELPYGALHGLLQEQYFPEEISPVTGSIYAETYIEDDSERFTFIVDLSLCEGGNEVLLYPDATVTDVRIECGHLYNGQYIAEATVLAASAINVGEAFHLTANLESEDMILRLIYHSDNQEYSSFITYDELGDSILLTNG